MCEKAVTTRSRAVSCDTCDNWTHSKCTGSISNEQYDKLVKNNSAFSYTCNACTADLLPFQNQTSIPNEPECHLPKNSKSISEDQSINVEFDCFRAKGLHFVGLNIRSLLPKIEQLKNICTNTTNLQLLVSKKLGLTIASRLMKYTYLDILLNAKTEIDTGVACASTLKKIYHIMLEMTSMTKNLEGIWIDILLPKNKTNINRLCLSTPQSKQLFRTF